MNIGDALSKGNVILKGAGIESAILDCQLILSKLLNKDRLYVMINRDIELGKEIEENFFESISLRSEKMPVKYIIKETEFMGLKFYIDNGVLIPRPETEILCEEVIDIIKRKKYTSLCDVCCGSGVIGISITKNIDGLKADCLDISEKAYEVTSINIKNMDMINRINVIKSDLLDYPCEEKIKYDVIVSNPPYIKTSDINALMKDVKDYEPHIALDGGDDGLYFYRKIITQSINVLNSGGLIAFEIGYDEGEKVKKLLSENNFVNVNVIQDLAGLNRVVTAIYN